MIPVIVWTWIGYYDRQTGNPLFGWYNFKSKKNFAILWNLYFVYMLQLDATAASRNHKMLEEKGAMAYTILLLRLIQLLCKFTRQSRVQQLENILETRSSSALIVYDDFPTSCCLPWGFSFIEKTTRIS
jgi:hypothetical protein